MKLKTPGRPGRPPRLPKQRRWPRRAPHKTGLAHHGPRAPPRRRRGRLLTGVHDQHERRASSSRPRAPGCRAGGSTLLAAGVPGDARAKNIGPSYRFLMYSPGLCQRDYAWKSICLPRNWRIATARLATPFCVPTTKSSGCSPWGSSPGRSERSLGILRSGSGRSPVATTSWEPRVWATAATETLGPLRCSLPQSSVSYPWRWKGRPKTAGCGTLAR